MSKTQISVGNDQFALIDPQDYQLVSTMTWHTRRSGQKTYVCTKRTIGGKTQVIYLHRLIAGVDRENVGFLNGDGLDCRRENLVIKRMSNADKPFARGALGEAMVIADLTRHGHDVFIPISGHTAADLISTTPTGKAIRWQVKYRSITKGSNSISVNLSAVHPQKGVSIRKPYNLNKFDGFAVYCPDIDEIFYIPVAAIDQTSGSFSFIVSQRPQTTAPKYTTPDIL